MRGIVEATACEIAETKCIGWYNHTMSYIPRCLARDDVIKFKLNSLLLGFIHSVQNEFPNFELIFLPQVSSFQFQIECTFLQFQSSKLHIEFQKMYLGVVK